MALCALVCSCGGDERPGRLGSDLGVIVTNGGFTGVPIEPPPEGYPEGPYGSEVGDTIEDFAFQGWRNPAAAGFDSDAYETLRFSDYFDPDGERGVRLLLLNTAAGWCSNCQIEHEGLASQLATYGPRGLVIFSMMYHGFELYEGASPQDAETWASDFNVEFPFVIDPTHRMGRYGAAEAAPLNLIVDPRDMTLIEKLVGNQEAVMWARIRDELEQRTTEP